MKKRYNQFGMEIFPVTNKGEKMKIQDMKIKDISLETLRKYLKQNEKSPLILGDDLEVTHYQNGDPIPLAKSNKRWMEFGKAEIGTYSINEKGDYLYNWYAVNDNRKLAPKGWRVPTDNEWKELEEQLKANPTYSGYRYFSNGNYSNIGYFGYFWSSSGSSSSSAWYRRLFYDSTNVYRDYYYKHYGFSVRCVKV